MKTFIHLVFDAEVVNVVICQRFFGRNEVLESTRPIVITSVCVFNREYVSDLEGSSLVPQLTNAAAPRVRPALTSHNQGNHAVRSDRWRYIQYADGTEELYDMEADPHEWQNLAGDPGQAAVLAAHRRWLPTIDRPPAPGSAHRVLTYEPATDGAIWEGTTVRRADPIPQ